MATGMNFSAFRAILSASMERLERLERTPKGRAELSAEYRAEAQELRRTTGRDLWRRAGGAQNTHVASPAELARRALERAADLERQAEELDAIQGIKRSPYEDYR